MPRFLVNRQLPRFYDASSTSFHSIHPIYGLTTYYIQRKEMRVATAIGQGTSAGSFWALCLCRDQFLVAALCTHVVVREEKLLADQIPHLNCANSSPIVEVGCVAFS